jgi:protein-tyrosine-phosphatase
MKQVLFVCTHNAGRSQMAEAFFNRYAPGDVRAESAGQHPRREGVWPTVIAAMQEVGIELGQKRPKKLMREMQLGADWAVTMGCGDACPYVPTTVENWELADPAGRPIEEVRAIRDEIEQRVRTGEELRLLIDAVHPLEQLPREPSATARVYRFRDGRGEIGFINPVSEPFCADCNRIRLTAEGKLRTCLFSLHETDLREPLRAGAQDSELEQVVREAVWRKELKHHIGEPGFRQPPRTMSAIGG